MIPIKVSAYRWNSADTILSYLNAEKIECVTTGKRRRTKVNEEGKNESYTIDVTTVWFDSGENREAYWDVSESIPEVLERIQFARQAYKQKP